MTPPQHEYQVIIVGAGAAGLGTATALQRMGISDFLILERDSIGASFKKWPAEMRFISPSFTGNNFLMVDLNAVTPDTSPAYALQTEHPTGKEYAAYLQAVAEVHELPVKTKQHVEVLHKLQDGWMIETETGLFTAKNVIWAAGEFQYPKMHEIPGTEYCLHNTHVESWSTIDGERHIIIGGYESGIDAAVNLSQQGKYVAVIDSEEPWNETHSDSSYSLSPYTKDRLRSEMVNGRIALQGNSPVRSVRKEGSRYVVQCDTKEIVCDHNPILANGFSTSLQLVKDHFAFADDGYPILTDDDESTVANGLFLTGPQVKHNDALFCFIYKYRQRFAIVAETIAKRLQIPEGDIAATIEEYQQYNFYLRDLSCCSNACAC